MRKDLLILALTGMLGLGLARAVGEEIANSQRNKIKDVSQSGIELIKQCEGFRPIAYWDIDDWAIGYGTRGGIKKGDRITPEQAEQRLVQDIDRKVEPVINQNVAVPLTQNQYDALASFVYNFGETKFRKSTLLQKLNSGDYSGASEQFLRWNQALNPKTGKREAVLGLTKRRTQELELFRRE